MDEILGLRAQKKLTTRRRILKSAATLFRQKGFTAATLEEVAARARSRCLNTGVISSRHR